MKNKRMVGIKSEESLKNCNCIALINRKLTDNQNRIRISLASRNSDHRTTYRFTYEEKIEKSLNYSMWKHICSEKIEDY